MIKKQEYSKLLFQELGENPYKQLNLAFSLISIIPILAIVYVIHSDMLVVGYASDVIRIFILVGVIILLGYIVGYRVMKKVIAKILAYAVKAKKADESKSAFAISLAHDLRSPLGTIKTSMSELKTGNMGALTKEQQNIISICDETSDRMNSIIAQLISTYMIEARVNKLTTSLFDLKNIIEEQYRELEASASAKKITITMDLVKKLIAVQADREKMIRVINNLLSNSIKYTPSGGKIVIKADTVNRFARMEFINNGPLIPRDRIEKIFDKFERLDTSVEGYGLGLSIAKDIVELHKGRIWAESQLGGMNCFTVLLPLAV